MTASRADYDYIVVGAGSSGCAAAYRLAEGSDAQVLLIEAGGRDSHPMAKIPIGFAKMIGEGRHNWNYRSVPEPALGGRNILLPRGRLLGGCSSINGMVYIRGQREDYDGWAAAGNSGWSYEELLPYFRRSEDYWGGESRFHGAGGPLKVARVAQTFPVADAFIEAAAQAGIPRNDDFNGARQLGAGYFDTNIDRGIRHSSARAYLRSVERPPNLSVLTGFEATRILFDQGRATSVEAISDGQAAQSERLHAREAIVLSAGAFNTPRLLELSGIGCAARLRGLGIDVVADSPEVGENLQDHCNNYLFFDTRDCDTYYRHIRPLRAPITLANYLFRRRGIFANPAAIVGAFLNLDEDSPRPDTQVHFAAVASQADPAGNLRPVPGVCASICQLRPESRGDSHIQSTDIRQAPAIRLNFLSTEREQQRQLRAIRKLRDIFSQTAIASMLGQELPPLAGMHSDEALNQGIRESLESVHHPCGTCRMGSDEGAVTQPDLSVRGVQGLRIADASIMPRIVSGNTHAACVMLGEKVADLLLGPA